VEPSVTERLEDRTVITEIDAGDRDASRYAYRFTAVDPAEPPTAG